MTLSYHDTLERLLAGSVLTVIISNGSSMVKSIIESHNVTRVT